MPYLSESEFLFALGVIFKAEAPLNSQGSHIYINSILTYFYWSFRLQVCKFTTTRKGYKRVEIIPWFLK